MSLYLYKTPSKAVEAEEGNNIHIFIQTPSKALRQKKELICHYIYTNPHPKLLRQKKELICHYIYTNPIQSC